MEERRLAVIGCGNMAKAILRGISATDLPISQIKLYDLYVMQYLDLIEGKITAEPSVTDAVHQSDVVLLSVKPQTYPDVLEEIRYVPNHEKKLYISIGAGITSQSVSDALHGAPVIRVLPNVPMLIGMGVSLICENPQISEDDFSFVQRIFESSGSVLRIDEKNMNPFIGVTSSSPAYVFRFIRAIYDGAVAQGLPPEGLMDAICDVVIGSATLLKNGNDTPDELITKVASKGGTTEQALLTMDREQFDQIVQSAMIACTNRAIELGKLRE